MPWSDIAQSDAPTVPATGRVILTVAQARTILVQVGDLPTLPEAFTFPALLRMAEPRHQALVDDTKTERWSKGPVLVFGRSSVEWRGQWTHGRTVTLRGTGESVAMTWDSGTGRPSRFIASLLANAGVEYTPPIETESPRALRERLGLAV